MNLLFVRRASLCSFMALAIFALTGGDVPSASAASPDVEVEKTASQTGGFVVGDITISNQGSRDASIDAIADSLEVHFPRRSPPPALPPGSTPNWYKVADVFVDHPAIVPAGGSVVIPYAFDLCDASGFAGANSMRNVVEVTISDAGGEKTAHARSDSFPPTTPECPATSLWLNKVDQDGEPLEGVELQVTFPDGSVDTCTTDAAGMCHFEDVPPGTYTVDEPASPANYLPAGCLPDADPAAPGAQVALNSGDETTVTCTNIRLIGEGSCIGDRACDGVTGIVGDGSCLGFMACQGSTGDVGDGSCAGMVACQSNAGDIGDNSCRGIQACLANTGNVGDGSCNGLSACLFNRGDVGNGSCIGTSACANNSAPIGDGKCNGDNVCAGNTTPMP